jgi:hypothetical protein
MKKTFFIIILTVLQSYRLTVISQTLQFYREDIVFKMSENQVTTDAQYHFCNTGGKDIKTTLFYPLPDKTMEQIDSLVIWNMKTNDVIPYREGKSGVFFGVSVIAYGQAAYRVYFSQWLVDKKFRYILTSTESWGRALEFANFELQVPVRLKIDSLSYPPDSTVIQNDMRYYFWKKKDFMPEEDFVLGFK